MPDESVYCILGRLEQKLDQAHEEISFMKEEQKEISDYIKAQKLGVRFVTTSALALLSGVVYFKEHLEVLLFGKATQ